MGVEPMSTSRERPSLFFKSALGVALLCGTATPSIGCANCGGPRANGSDSGLISAGDASSAIYPPDATPDDPNEHRFQGLLETEINRITDDAMARDTTEVIDFTIKGDAYRWDLLEGSVPRGDYRVYDRSAHRFYSVLKSEGLILSTPESSYLLDGGGGEIPHYAMEDEGTAGNVEGHACEMYRVQAPPYTYEVCASGDFVPFPFSMLSGRYQETIPFAVDLVDRKLFPLFVNQMQLADAGASRADGGRRSRTLISTFRVRHIQPQRVDPAVFILPKYTVRRTQILMTSGKLER